ncbi:hypothetical protein BH11PLA1_BH11PLA1_20700 [soil metagenome]
MNAQRLLVLTAGALAVAALLPARTTTLLGLREGVRAGVEMVTIPVQYPLAWLMRSARGNGAAGTNDSDGERRALADAAEWKREALRARDEVETVRAQMGALQRAAQLNPVFIAKETTPLPIVGFSERLLLVRGGMSLGVLPGAVAVAERVHLIGRVVAVDQLLCRVRPINEREGRDGPEIKGVIFGDERFIAPESATVMQDTTRGGRALVSLKPTERGTLAGFVFNESGSPGGPLRPEVGMVVRLDDPSWSAADQMLIVGRITQVDEAANGRLVVVVTPAIDPQRVSDVTLRFTGDAPAGTGGGRP